jgi:hypothetical protein
MVNLSEVGLFDSKWKYLVLLGGFFLIEVILSIWTGLPYDNEIWFNTGKWMTQGINIYEPPHHLGYPPLWALWCSVAYHFHNFFGNSMEVWRFVIKLPMILAHLGLAYALGVFATNRFDRKTGLKIFLVTLTWSFFIYVGALWGQINTLSALLTFLAFYAIIKQRTTASALLLATAITLKIYPLITLPAFFAYILRNRNKKEACKFLLICCSLPTLFTALVFVVFNWDIMFFLKTILYSTPILENNPAQILGGCMNVWSFFALPALDIGKHWIFRMLWIPIMGLGAIYWLRKKKMDDLNLSISIVSLYIMFMISYGWISEQSFLDPLPFIFLIIIAYRPRKLQFYLLIIIQILVYAFSLFNWGPFIFEHLAERFFPTVLQTIWSLAPSKSTLIWNIRGILGLTVSIFLGIFLLLLLKQDDLTIYFKKILNKIPIKFKK